MIKKILSITGFIAFFSLLIWGGVIRTQAVYGITGSEGTTTSENSGTLPAAVEVAAADWLTLTGSVQSWDGATLVVLTDTGETILVERRAGRFLAENGFSASPGDRVSLTGYDENGTFEVAVLTNESNGVTVRLRSEDGVPAWSTGGR